MIAALCVAFAALVSGSSAFANPNQCVEIFERRPLVLPAVHARAQELGQKLFAVHATTFLPTDGVLKAGARHIDDKEGSAASDVASFRPTVHFSLGELVRPHRGGEWDDKPYAVLMPIHSIEKQLVNISPYDTFALGNVTLPKETIFIVLEKDAHRVPPGFKIFIRRSSLREAIDQAIREAGGWKLTMIDRADTKAPAYLDGHNINSEHFFDPLLQENPSLSFGDHLHSEVGEIYRMGNIDQLINWMMKSFKPYGTTARLSELTFKESLILRHLKKLDAYLANADLPADAMAVYRLKRKKLHGWLNLIEIERRVQKEFGMTITRPGEAQSKRLSFLKDHPSALRAYVFSLARMHLLRRAERDETHLSAGLLVDYLGSMPPAEVREVLQKFPDALAPSQANKFWIEYAASRALVMHGPRSRSENLIGLLESKMSRPFTDSQAESIAQGLFDSLERELDPSSTRLPVALDILSRPSVRAFLARAIGMHLPSGAITLDDVLKNHPDTRALYVAQVELPLDENSRQAQSMVERLNKDRYGAAKSENSPLNFERAVSKIRNSKWAAESLSRSIEAVQRPMTATQDLDKMRIGSMLTIYEQISRGDFGTLDQFAERLGLSSARFRQKFPSDRDFWRSSESLLEIYESLKTKP